MSRYYRQVSRPRLVDTPRLPSAPTFHAPQILMAEVYSQVTPGTGGEVLPLCWNKHGDGGDPEYLAILPATDVYSMIDPFHICCGGKGDRFFVYFDPYRKVWMPLAPYGLIRNGELGDQLAPQGQSDGSTINLFDKDGNGGWRAGGRHNLQWNQYRRPDPVRNKRAGVLRFRRAEMVYDARLL